MLRWMSGNILKDRIKNVSIWRKLEVAPIKDKMRKTLLRCFAHVQKRPINATVRKIDCLEFTNTSKRTGRPCLINITV